MKKLLLIVALFALIFVAVILPVRDIAVVTPRPKDNMKFVSIVLLDEDGNMFNETEFQVVYRNGVNIYIPGASFMILAQPGTVVECTYIPSDLTLIDEEIDLLQDTVCVVPPIDGYMLAHIKISGDFEIVLKEPYLSSLGISGEFEIDISDDLLKN